MSTSRTVLIIAALTLREASRRRVLTAVAVLTVALLALSGWGFSRLAAESTLTSGEAKLAASQVLNLVMFGFSLIAALGTAFLAGPTLSGETESGIALAVLARPIRRSAFLLGKWLGLAVFGSAFIVLAGLAECLVVLATVDYWPPEPGTALALLAAQTSVLLTLSLLLSTVISPMASGVVAVGLFGATWVAGVVGGAGQRRRRARGHRLADARAHRRSLARGHARLPGSRRSRAGGSWISDPERRAADRGLPRVGRDGLGAGDGVVPPQGSLTVRALSTAPGDPTSEQDVPRNSLRRRGPHPPVTF